MNKPVVTRFAPSPTGFLHIGGARTALFNWLFTRQHGGKMHLRIEDTDRERSTKEAIDAIVDGLKWLGLTWDDEIVYQFSRAGRHAQAVQDLLAKGHAYYCYATPEELEEMRAKARAESRPPRYDGRWRDRDPSEAPSDIKPVVRLKAPQEGEIVVDDLVQGRVVFQNKDLDDLVLLRSDGTPTYMLAVVVDDHDMGITHVIRGDDHLTNAARQTHIYQAFGWDVPIMAHIPMIHGADGAKLSKRHGALGVDAYRAMGYLPEALRNYLVRLGWSHGNQEFFTESEMVEAFNFTHVGRSPSRFDFLKLEHMNAYFLRLMPDQELFDYIMKIFPELPQAAELMPLLNEQRRAQLLTIMTGLKERAKTINELVENSRFLFDVRPLQMDEKAAELIEKGGRQHLEALLPRLELLAEWAMPAMKEVVEAYALEVGAKLGHVAQPLRAALTGHATSPGIFDVLYVLGREESLGRIKDVIG